MLVPEIVVDLWIAAWINADCHTLVNVGVPVDWAFLQDQQHIAHGARK